MQAERGLCIHHNSEVLRPDGLINHVIEFVINRQDTVVICFQPLSHEGIHGCKVVAVSLVSRGWGDTICLMG